MNPFKEAAPWARIVTLIVLGTVIIFGIGRWDQRIAAQDAVLVAQTKAILATSRTARMWRDSLRGVEDLVRERDAQLAAAAARHRSELARLAEVDQVEVEQLARTPLDDLLPSLRMRPIRPPDAGDPQPRIVYATDSAGVRFLSGRMLRLAQLERAAAPLDSLVDTQAARIRLLAAGLAAASLRGDSSEARLAIMEPLLERHLKRLECRILWLVPCPSRTTAFVLGAVVGGALILSR